MSAPWKDCQNECRIQTGSVMETLAYYQPVYDKFGNNLNPDRNTSFYDASCATCGKKWSVTRGFETTEYTLRELK